MLPENARDRLNGWSLFEKREGDQPPNTWLRVGYRKALTVKDKPAIALDATGNDRLIRLALPHLTRFDELMVDAPFARVLQAYDRKNAKSSLVDDWHDDENRKAEKANRRAGLVEIAEALGYGRSTALLSYKGVADSDQVREAPEPILPGHFGLLRGQNGWENVHGAVVAGRWLTKETELERLAGALFYDQPETVGTGGKIVEAIGYHRLRNGELVEGLAEVHSSPTVELVRRQITEAELEQAIGRARGVRRTSDKRTLIALLTTTPLRTVLVDELTPFDTLVPNALELNIARSGVFLENASHAHKAFPGLFRSEAAAKKAYQRRRTSPFMDYNKGTVPHLAVSYQRAGAGQKPTRAYLDVQRVGNARDWLEQRLGRLARFEHLKNEI